MNQQQQNHCLRMDSSICLLGVLNVFKGTKTLPKKCSARMEAFLLLQCIIMEKHTSQIITLDETKKRTHDSQIVRAKKTQVEPWWANLSIKHHPTLDQTFDGQHY